MRRQIFAVTGIALLSIMTGCGQNDDQADTVEGEPADESSDATPDQEGADSDAASEQEGTGSDAAPDAEAALLTLNDMPSGWTQAQDTETSNEASAICDQEPMEDFDPVDEASADFTGGDLGPMLFHSVAVYEDDQAEQAIDTFLNTMDSCDEWTEEGENGTTTFEAKPLSFSSYGDQTVAVRIQADSEAVGVTMDMVVWRRDDTLSVLGMGEVMSSPDGETTEELVEIADERLADLE